MKNTFLFIVSLLLFNTGFSQYCTPAYTYGYASCYSYGLGINYFFISGESPTSILDNSTCTGSGYENHTGLTVNLKQGHTYTANISSSSGSSNLQNCQVWIDFNNDNIFEASESVGGLNNYLSGSFSIYMPPSSVLGYHRMRIITSFSSDGYLYPTMNPCTSGYLYGDSRDYTVNIIANTCSGTPSAGYISASVDSGCSAFYSTLTTIGYSIGLGITYQWQTSIDSITWTDKSGATTTTLSVLVTATCFARLKVICLNSSDTSYSNPIKFYVLPALSSITGPTNICQGSNITLSSSHTGGTWTSSNSAIATVGITTGIVSGISSGIGIITYSLFSTCYVTRNVTVNTLPNITPINVNLCVGAQITLISLPIGGAWYSSDTLISTIDTGLLIGISSGINYITYSLPTGCWTLDSIHINPLPDSITGYTNVCEGSQISLYSSPAGGTWYSSNNSIANVGYSNGIVIGGSSGLATITYSLTSGCSVFQNVTVNTTPSVFTGPTNVCENSGITLVTYPTGGTWSSSNTSIASVATTGIVTGVSQGTTSISYSISDGCYQDTSITVNSLPNPVINYSVYGPCLFVNSYYSCQWFLNGNAVSGATNNILFPTSSGIYTIEVVDSNGCSATSSPFVFIPEAIISCNLSEIEINIFPNPASSVINFETKMPINISIISIAGNIILDQKNASSVNIENLSEGLYIIRISDENGTFIKNEKLSVLRR